MLHINNILVFVEAYRCDREIYGLFILKPQVVKVEICHNLISDGLASYRSLRLNKLRIISRIDKPIVLEGFDPR